MEGKNGIQDPNYLLGVRDILKESWTIYKDRWKTLVVISIFPFILFIPAFLSISVAYLISTKQAYGFILPEIILIALTAIVAIVVCLWSPLALLYAIKDRDEKIGFRTSFGRSRSKILPYLGLTILNAILIMLGFVLFLIPGFIFIVWFEFSTYILVSENLGPVDSLKKSKDYVNGKFFAILFRMLGVGIVIAIIYAIISAIPVINVFSSVIQALLLSPLATIAFFVLYERIRGLNAREISNPPSKGLIYVFMAFIILMVILFATLFAYVIPNSLKSLNRPPSYTAPGIYPTGFPMQATPSGEITPYKLFPNASPPPAI